MGPKDMKQGSGMGEGCRRGLGHTIKVLRVDQGQTREELGERAGISYSYVTQIENGKKLPSSSVLALIADALGVSSSDLLALSEKRDASGRPLLGLGRVDTPPALGPQASERSRLHYPAEMPEASSSPHHARPDARESPGGAGPTLTLDEVWGLLARLSPQDLERVLDLARRLAG